MRKLLVTTFLTLDGVMQAPGGPGEDDSGGFAYGGWSMTYWDDGIAASMSEMMGKPFDLVLGRRTYDSSGRSGRTPPRTPARKPLNEPPSTSRRAAAGARLGARGPARGRRGRGRRRAQAGRRARAPGPRQRRPDPDAAAPRPHRRVPLLVFPVLVGSGKRLFADGAVPAGLKLVDSASRRPAS